MNYHLWKGTRLLDITATEILALTTVLGKSLLIIILRVCVSRIIDRENVCDSSYEK